MLRSSLVIADYLGVAAPMACMRFRGYVMCDVIIRLPIGWAATGSLRVVRISAIQAQKFRHWRSKYQRPAVEDLSKERAAAGSTMYDLAANHSCLNSWYVANAPAHVMTDALAARLDQAVINSL